MARERVARSNGSNGAPGPRVRSSLSVAELRQLIALMNSSDIREIAIEHEEGNLRLTLRKPEPIALPAAPAGEAPELEPLALEEAEEEQAAREKLVEVRSPLVGIFRAALKRGASPLVAADAPVEQGQVVAAVEALNVLTEVEAGAPGRVKQILVSEGQAVEYGQPLLLIDPA
jgi:acetyl-CoA carboxylase biotin carboxyl carrier protein